MVDQESFKKRVLLDLINAPTVLIPPALGVTMTLATWAVGQFVAMGTFIGITGIILGAGAFFTRLFTRQDEVARDVFQRMQSETLASRDARFDELAKQLDKDKDPRTNDAVEKLRIIQHTLDGIRQDIVTASAVDSTELLASCTDLIQYCLDSLGRSFKLWQMSQTMMTRQARQDMIAKREKLLEEINQSIIQIAHALDGIRTLGIEDNPGQKLAAIRRQLNGNLELARKVDERMQSLEREIEGDIQQQ